MLGVKCARRPLGRRPCRCVLRHLVRVLALAGALSSSLPVVARAEEAARSRAPSVVEEITVTAEKAERSLQETALSIQAFGVEDMAQMGLSDTHDIGRFTPGFTFIPGANGTGKVSFTGRGAGVRDINPLNSQTVGLYIDGMYIGTGEAANFDLLDIERIEVMKGPQGTLFGRNTIGGAVSVISQKPGPELGGSVEATAGTYDERTIRGSLNVPFIEEKLFGRIALVRKSRDPFVENRLGNGDWEDLDEKGVRLAFRWIATDAITADYSFTRIAVDSQPQAHILRMTVGPPVFPPASEIQREKDDIQADARVYSRVDSWQHVFGLTWDVAENLQVKSISGWKKYRQSDQGDFDGSSAPGFVSGVHGSHETFYQELQSVGTLLDHRIEYALGATWFDEESDLDNYQQFGPDWLFFFDPSARMATLTQGENWAWGAYGQVTAHATDRLHVTAGLRYSKERKEILRALCQPSNGVIPSIQDCLPADLVVPSDRRDFRSDNWAPLFRVAYDWNDDLMTYLSWTRGYRSGGYSIRFSTPDPRVFLPYEDETVSQWEVGLKSQWWENRIRLNASAYYSQYEDMQVAPWVGGAVQWTNAGEARIRGWEVELAAVPVEGLSIRLTHGWTKADFVKFVEDDPTTPAYDPTNRARFHRVACQPRRTHSGVVTYTFPSLGIGTFEISGNFARSSEVGFYDQLVQYNRIEGRRYTIYGGRIGLHDAFGAQGLSLAVVGQNLGDRSYEVFGIDFGSEATGPAFGTNMYGDPRHVVFEVKYEF